MCEKIISVHSLVMEAETLFTEKFSATPKIKAFGPGRVNLIGEHTDYNDGFVMPLALPMGTVVVGSINNSDICNIQTMTAELSEETFIKFNINDLKKLNIKWVNYIIGVLDYFPCSEKFGFNAVINSSLPLGSGLSSSASLEVSFYTFLEGIYGIKDNTKLSDKALICQKSENSYAGVPCGIMDQFIAFMGKTDHALMIDCRDYSSCLVPLKDPLISILIINSNVKHDLGTSEYPLRRNNCHEAAKKLKRKTLRDVTIDYLEDNKNLLNDIEFRRAKHVVSENERVLQTIKCLENSDFVNAGKLMYESHISLRNYFEVSCVEIDQLVDIVQNTPGVFGTRITGGGFGGCTVTLLKNSSVSDVICKVNKEYTGKPLFYVCSPCDGAKLL